MRWTVVLALTLSLAGCGSCDEGGDHAPKPSAPPAPPPPPPPGGGSWTTSPTVPTGSVPPIGVTWHIAITENVPLSQMQALYATFVSVNDTIWNISEGQVRVHKFRIWDNVAPGVTASQFMFGAPFDTSNYDVVAFPGASWNVPMGGAVTTQPGMGRNNRLMIIPTHVSTFVGTHEGGHFLWQLTWSVGALLVDEYNDGVQDAACVMESENTPYRWCSSGNHASQSSQPQSCWSQILADYPAFSHSGTNTAATPAPVPEVEYNDVP